VLLVYFVNTASILQKVVAFERQVLQFFNYLLEALTLRVDAVTFLVSLVGSRPSAIGWA
jgi:hypothetical protein